ncbi:MAG: ice-binding family protein, partial [Gammaproteobacteria bacterium]|nr:ice-binding family protein [Gammaproteobacteria bacterium]
MNRFESPFKPLTWFMVLLLSAFLAACGGGGGGSSGAAAPATTIAPGAVCSVAGATIPKVTASEPSNGNQFASISTTTVAPSKLITASFSLVMDPATLNSAPAGMLLTFTVKETVSGADVPGTVAMNVLGPAPDLLPSNLVATFTTTAALSASTSYTATITPAAKSATSVAMGCTYTWTFKTTPPAGVGSIDLGILGPFGMASAGGLTNTGATQINGDVVLNPNATCNSVAVGTGDDFGLCNGGGGTNPPTHNVGDKVTTQTHPDTTTADAVRAVLLAKWNSLSPANTPGATVLGCGVIGTAGGAGAGIGCDLNATLPAGVYISATASSIGISGTLTLNGSATDVWVFQAPSSTVTAAVGSTIVLTGGAKASNVWWYVGSSATLNANAVFQGNILASASISMGNLATSCGR